MPDRPTASGAARSGGFSLLELLVTLAVAAVLLGLALPSFRSLMGDSETSATVNELVTGLQTARSEAIKRAGLVALCASAAPLTDGASCDGAGYADGWIVYVDRDGDGARDPDATGDAEETLLVQAEPRSPAFDFPAGGALYVSQVRFSDTGASVGPGEGGGPPRRVEIELDYADGVESRRVVVAANGRVASHAPES